MSHPLYTTGIGQPGTIFIDDGSREPWPYNPNDITNVIRYTGPRSTPRSIRRQRGSNLDAMRKYGTPVVIKHMYNDQDVQDGIAEATSDRDPVYGQTRRGDMTYGVGYVSVEKSDNEWIGPDGTIVVSDVSPGSSYVRAPKYRGYGPGYLVYAILPDVSEDVFKLTEYGALIRTQQAQVQMGWYPEVNDNDLLVIVQIDRDEQVTDTRERFLLKMTSPVSMRGLDRGGRREYTEDFGNRHVTDQTFEMSLVPDNDAVMNLPIRN